MMHERWMTYADAAAALRMTPDSLRARARRELWRKQLGNDGRALVLIPPDTSSIPGGDGPGDPPASRQAKRVDPDQTTAVLQARLADLEDRAARLSADVERERGERIQERERADHLAGEVADLARQLASTIEGAVSREQDLRRELGEASASAARANALEAEIKALRALTFWQRLRGLARA